MNFFLYRTTYGDSTDPVRRVPAIESALTDARKHERRLLSVRDELSADLKAREAEVVETRVDTAEKRRQRADLTEAIGHIDNGFGYAVGVLPVVSAFLNTPGVVETRAAIKQLEEERKAWTLLRDDHEPRPYRLKPGLRHVVDGRLVLPGETVMLTPTAFKAFGDKFQAIDAEEASATT